MNASANVKKAMVPRIARMFQGNGASGRLNQKSEAQMTSQAMIHGAARRSMLCSVP